jgi:hypothetical protein
MVQVGEHPGMRTLLVLVGAIAWIVAITVAGILRPTDLAAVLKYVSFATGAASILYFLLSRYLWRWPIFQPILNIPDLSGRWEGWSFRTLSGEWVPSAHEISQQALDIAANAWGPNNMSRGICASIVCDRLGGAVEFIWSYKTETIGPQARSGDTHQGTHLHHLSKSDGQLYLTGIYITDRVRRDGTLGSVGAHRLVWVSKKLKHGYHFTSESMWGMPKPSAPPEGHLVAPLLGG